MLFRSDKLSVQSRISADDLKRWVQENGPKVEVKSYGAEGKVSEAAKELGRMQHEMDSMPASEGHVQYSPRTGEHYVKDDRGNIVKNVKPELRAKLKRMDELQAQVDKEPADTTPKMTGQQVGAYKHVSPKSTEEPMPEWTTSKSGKNVQRVDVVIPEKYTHIDKYGERMPETPKWSADQLHEQHPNTLGWAAIQYETGPNGEKIAHIFEVQSSWGQAKYAYEKAIKEGKTPAEARRISAEAGSGRPYSPEQNHALLKDHQRLILKAAIEQARKEGATHIAISDAETAMMSEGHDAGAKDRKSTRLNSSHIPLSRMPSSA